MFIHDSLHTYDFETAEFAAVGPSLRADAFVLSDNAHASAALSTGPSKAAAITSSSGKSRSVTGGPEMASALPGRIDDVQRQQAVFLG